MIIGRYGPKRGYGGDSGPPDWVIIAAPFFGLALGGFILWILGYDRFQLHPEAQMLSLHRLTPAYR